MVKSINPLDFIAGGGDFIAGFARQKGYRVYLKTNLGPAVKVYDAAAIDDGAPNLLEQFGFKQQIIIVDKSGAVVSTLGQPAPTDPLKSALVGALLVGVAGVLLRGLIK